METIHVTRNGAVCTITRNCQKCLKPATAIIFMDGGYPFYVCDEHQYLAVQETITVAIQTSRKKR